MGVFFIYILKSSVCLVLFYLFFRLLLSKETFHRFNRMALLGVLFFSLLIPCIEVTTRHQVEVQQAVLSIEQLLLMAELEATPANVGAVQETPAISWVQIVLLVYLAGILFLACRNIYSLICLFRLIHSGKHEKLEKGVTLVVHNQEIAPFSWMKYIVISRKDLEENGREILIHEMAHIHHRHSVDLLVADICIFFQWFNPGAWLLKQELQNVHEYEADETVINEGVNAKEYQLLLIKKAVGTRLYSMANSFNHSKLKKRITMMLKEKSNPWAKLKYLYILPVAAIAVTAFARPEISETAEEISRMSDALGMEQASLLFSRLHDISAAKVNDLTAIVEAKAVKTTEEPVQVAPVLKDTAKPVEVKYIPAEVTEKLQGTPFFEVVEQMPEYPGGMAAALEYIQKNMRYPETAKKNGTQGRVTVQFIIDKGGNVTDPKVIRAVDKDLDAEAIRLIGMMPKWKPGMQKGQAVAVKYTLPVMFRLEGGEMKSSRTVEMSRRPGSLLDSALVIVDGKEVTQSILNAINVDRIMSFSVLKDAASTAIYGERGKNGVILITLKEDKEEYHPSETYTLKNTNDPVVLGVKGTGKFTTVNGVQGIYINSKKANRGDVTFFVDGVKIDSSVADIGEVVPAERIESMSVEKGTDGKGQIYITTKDKRGVEKTSAKGDMKVEGIVQDKDGEPVVGAAILIEGTKSGSITDVDGRFVLSASKGDKLVVSYIGMKTAKVKAEPKVTVTLKDE